MNSGLKRGIGQTPLEADTLAVGGPWGEYYEGFFGGSTLFEDPVQQNGPSTSQSVRPQPFTKFSVWQREAINSSDFTAPVATIIDQRTFVGPAPVGSFSEAAALQVNSSPRFSLGSAPAGGISGIHLSGTPTMTDSTVTIPRSSAISMHWNCENATYTIASGVYAHVGSVQGTQTETRVFEAETAKLFSTLLNQQGFYYRGANAVNDTGLTKTNWGFVIGGTNNQYGNRFASWHNGNIAIGGAGTRFTPTTPIHVSETKALSGSRTVTDGVTTAFSFEVSSATANFTIDDIGKSISGTNITAGSYIVGLKSATVCIISQGQTASGTGITLTFGAGLANGFASALRLVPNYDQAQTVTRHNYFELSEPTVMSGTEPQLNGSLTNGAAITDSCVFFFNAGAGTHKAVDAGTTKTSPGTVSAWMKVNINGTVYYMPAYTSKTS